MSLDENISHCFREYPKMKRRIEILETENQRLQAEVARMGDAVEGERRMKQVYRDRVAELEATNQVLIATKISIHQATKAALEWAAINPWYPADQLELFEEYIDRGLAALLGDNE